MKRAFCVFCCLLVMMLCFASCGGKNNVSPTKQNDVYSDETHDMIANNPLLSGKHNVDIVFKGYGTVSLELDADEAPVTVTHFVDLVKHNFYNGLDMFKADKTTGAVYGGKANAKSDKSLLNPIEGEFATNGVENNIEFKPGVIGMFTDNGPNTATSVFFITTKDNSDIYNGHFAGFGAVKSGTDVVEKIYKDVLSGKKVIIEKAQLAENK